MESSIIYYVVVNNTTSESSLQPNGEKQAVFTFTTGTISMPIVNMIEPANGDTNVSRTPNISIKFSESVSNVNSNNVKLYQNSSTSATSIEIG